LLALKALNYLAVFEVHSKAFFSQEKTSGKGQVAELDKQEKSQRLITLY
jgi:hypothetical protein